ncbi:MAG: phage holin family protein, partial [Myxococcota bacterium]
MPGFFVRLLIGALGLGLASVLLPGVQVAGPGSLVLASLLLGLVNAVVRPLV